jgi:hypothetical protein
MARRCQDRARGQLRSFSPQRQNSPQAFHRSSGRLERSSGRGAKWLWAKTSASREWRIGRTWGLWVLKAVAAGAGALRCRRDGSGVPRLLAGRGARGASEVRQAAALKHQLPVRRTQPPPEGVACPARTAGDLPQRGWRAGAAGQFERHAGSRSWLLVPLRWRRRGGGGTTPRRGGSRCCAAPAGAMRSDAGLPATELNILRAEQRPQSRHSGARAAHPPPPRPPRIPLPHPTARGRRAARRRPSTPSARRTGMM